MNYTFYYFNILDKMLNMLKLAYFNTFTIYIKLLYSYPPLPLMMSLYNES